MTSTLRKYADILFALAVMVLVLLIANFADFSPVVGTIVIALVILYVVIRLLLKLFSLKIKKNTSSVKSNDSLMTGQMGWKAIVFFGLFLIVVSLFVFGFLVFPGILLICVGLFIHHEDAHKKA